MSRPTNAWRKVMAQPGPFTLRVLKAFQKNQGLLLSGALAYYILLSVIPLFTFLLLMLSHVVDEAALLATLRRYIGLIIPGDSAASSSSKYETSSSIGKSRAGSCYARCCSSARLRSACSRALCPLFSFIGCATNQGR